MAVFIILQNSSKRSQTLRSGLFVPGFVPTHTPKQKAGPDQRGPSHPTRFALPPQLSGNGRDQGAARTRSARRTMPPSAPRSAWPAPQSTPRSWLPLRSWHRALRSSRRARRAPYRSRRHLARLLARAPSTPAARLRPADRLAAVSALRPAPARHPDHRPWGPPSVSGRQRKSLLPISRRKQAIGAPQMTEAAR